MRGSGGTVPSSAVLWFGSVAAEQSYCLSWLGVPLGPNTCSNSLFLVSSRFPCLSAPLSRPKFHLSSPKEEVSEVLSVESLNDSGFIAQFPAFYRPNKTLTDI